MTFYSREAQDGLTPVELVTFARGQGSTARLWRYATSDRDVTLSGMVYRGSTVQRSALTRAAATSATTWSMTMATGTPFVAEWTAADPIDSRGVTSVTILRAHLDAAGVVVSTGLDQRAVIAVGTVTGLEIDGEETTVQCASLDAQLATLIPRVPITRTCPWSVYDAQCGLDPTAVARTGTVASLGVVSDTSALLTGAPTATITMTGSAPLLFATDLDASFFHGGVLSWTESGRTVRMHIDTANLSAWPTIVCVLQAPLPSAAIGDAVTLWPGCQKTIETCRDRFANVNRFGGFHRLPSRNPLRQRIY